MQLLIPIEQSSGIIKFDMVFGDKVVGSANALESALPKDQDPLECAIVKVFTGILSNGGVDVLIGQGMESIKVITNRPISVNEDIQSLVDKIIVPVEFMVETVE